MSEGTETTKSYNDVPKAKLKKDASQLYRELFGITRMTGGHHERFEKLMKHIYTVYDAGQQHGWRE